MRKEEPAITVYSVEDDGEEGMDTAKMVSQRVHTDTLEKKTQSSKSLRVSRRQWRRRSGSTRETLEKKKDAVIEKREAVIKELQARVKSFEDTQEDNGDDKK